MNLRALVLSVALCATSIVTAPAFASDKDDVLSVVNQFNDYGNKLDEKSASALCADRVVIIDMIAPFSWNGTGACSTWMKDGAADSKANGTTDVVGTFGDSSRVIIAGSHAYAAIPTIFTYKVNGKMADPLRGIWTFTLQKLPVGWRITGFSWGLQ